MSLERSVRDRGQNYLRYQSNSEISGNPTHTGIACLRPFYFFVVHFICSFHSVFYIFLWICFQAFIFLFFFIIILFLLFPLPSLLVNYVFPFLFLSFSFQSIFQQVHIYFSLFISRKMASPSTHWTPLLHPKV